ncbi:MAG: hypothetical protein ABFE07_00550 [Armatimonadia bacterium]
MKTWPIASEVTVESPNWHGRFVVEDVTEQRIDGRVHTTTYRMRSLDGVPPFGLGLFGAGHHEDLL